MSMTDIKINSGINLNINKPKPKPKMNNKPTVSKYVQKNRTKSLDEIKAQVNNTIEKLGGKYVKFDDIDHTEGLMVAGILDESLVEEQSNMDKVCFAIMNRDKKIVYINNNEHFSILQNIPSSLYILDYLYTHEPETLLNYAEAAFDDDKVNVFTKICINIPKKKFNKKNKTKK